MYFAKGVAVRSFTCGHIEFCSMLLKIAGDGVLLTENSIKRYECSRFLSPSDFYTCSVVLYTLFGPAIYTGWPQKSKPITKVSLNRIKIRP